MSAVATLVVAAYAIQIEHSISKQEAHRAAVSRSVALYEQLIGSTDIDRLRDLAHRIDTKLKPGSKEDEFVQEAVTIFRDKRTIGNRISLNRSLVGLLQAVRVIHRCGKFDEYAFSRIAVKEPTKSDDTKTGDPKRKPSAGEPLCDRETIAVLLGGVLSELYFRLRPVMYCEAFFKENYFRNEAISSVIGKYEDVLLFQLDREYRGHDWWIFRHEGELKEKLDAGEVKEHVKNWSVLRLPEERCKHYPSK